MVAYHLRGRSLDGIHLKDHVLRLVTLSFEVGLKIFVISDMSAENRVRWRELVPFST